MVALQDGFRQEDGDIAVEGRGIPEFGNQVAALAENELADHVIYICHSQLHLAVDAGLPGVLLHGIVPVAVSLQVEQDGTDEQVMVEAENCIGILHQGEIDFRVAPA